MADFRKLSTTLAYARLGLVSLTAAVAPITGAAQELCGTDLFAGEPDEASLMGKMIEFLDILETNGVVAFDGSEGRVSVSAARQALQDGVGSATLLSCVVNSDTIEFTDGDQNLIIACNAQGTPTIVTSTPAENATDADTVAATADGADSPAGGNGADASLISGGTDTPLRLEVSEDEAEAEAEADTAETTQTTGALFCSTEVATISQYLSSEA